MVETGEALDGTISAVLADEESLMWVRFGGGDGKQVVVELAMRADKYAIRTRDSQSPVFTEFDGVPTFEYRPDLVVEASFRPYPEPVDVPIGTANPLVDGVHRSVGDLVFRLPGKDHEFHLQAEEEKLGALTVTFHDETNGDSTDEWRKVSTARPRPGRLGGPGLQPRHQLPERLHAVRDLPHAGEEQQPGLPHRGGREGPDDRRLSANGHLRPTRSANWQLMPANSRFEVISCQFAPGWVRGRA